jgi:hypothetical protein
MLPRAPLEVAAQQWPAAAAGVAVAAADVGVDRHAFSHLEAGDVDLTSEDSVSDALDRLDLYGVVISGVSLPIDGGYSSR